VTTSTSLDSLDLAAVSAAGVSALYIAGPEGRTPVCDRLSKTGLALTRVSDVAGALRAAEASRYDLCLVDLADARGAVATVRTLRAHCPNLAVAGIMDPACPLTAAEAIDAGIVDLLPWPFDERDIAALVANTRDGSMGVEPETSSTTTAEDRLFAHSPAMRQAVDLARAAAGARGGVLLVGEPGSGREFLARLIHGWAHRTDAAFVSVTCVADSPEELEDRLFGVASDRQSLPARARLPDRLGKSGGVYAARGGTLFLDAIVQAPARVQAKLVRLSRDGEALLVEKRVAVDLDFRLMATVEPGIQAALADGRLRRDLYERLAVMPIEVPPLRRRREDIPLLAVHLLGELRRALGAPPQRFSRAALALLSALPWPGNGTELRALVETLVRSVDRAVIQLDDLLEHVRLDGVSPRVDVSGTLRDAKARFERDWISAVLMKHQGRVEDAARALGIQRTNLYRKVRQLKVARTLLARKA
jgi:DNA-binding NtrC family response regulator